MKKHQHKKLLARIESSLLPGQWIPDRDLEEFVVSLHVVRQDLDAAKSTAGAAAILPLLETFLAGCFEKAEHVRDTHGSFRDFVGALFDDWIRARQEIGAGALETARLLLAWTDADDYGICGDLERKVVRSFDRAGLDAYEQVARQRWGAHPADSFEHRRLVSILKAIHARRRDVAAYAAQCESEGSLEPDDCEKLATLALERRRPEQALEWAQRGMGLLRAGQKWSPSSWTLPELERRILQKLGRPEAALARAFEAFAAEPWLGSYRALMKLVPVRQRKAWHGKAMAAAEHTEVSARIELFAAAKEWERLEACIAAASHEELARVGFFHAVPIARRLGRRAPALAAKLRIALALDILGAKRSRGSGMVLEHLEQARRHLLAAGKAGEWEALAQRIRAEHRLKRSFMAAFEQLGRTGEARGPELAARARAAWAKRAQGGQAGG